MEQSSSTVARSEKKSIACRITEKYIFTKKINGFEISTYNVETIEKSVYFWSEDKSIHEILDEVITKHGNDIGIIVIYDENGYFKKEDFKKYGNLVHLATKEELDFNGYLKEKVEYSVGEFIFWLYNKEITLYQCTTAVEGRGTWKELDRREHIFNKCIDFEYAARMFGLRVNQVHVVFEDSEEEVNELYGSELNKYGFKSINFSKWAVGSESLLLARYLISDSEVSVLVKIEDSDKINLQTYTIEDCNFIHIPKLVEEYEARTDIMGIDLGSTRSVLAVSRNRQIHVIPFDNSSPGDLWTESVVSFDEEKPIIGRAAVRRLRTKPDHVIFDHKLLCNDDHRNNISKQSIWPFKFSFKEDQPHLGSQTCRDLEDFSLSKINAIFLERMAEAASEYQDGLHNGNSVRKAVITVPRYSNNYISSTIEAAKLANIEVIDIIEETHADLLYYLSNDRYSEMIKPGKKIAIFDIGGGTRIWKVYEISEHEGKIYATCIRESYWDYDAKCSGRAIDNIIIEELEKSIPWYLRSDVKLRTLEAAKKIKQELSFEEKTELDLSDIHPRLEGMVEFTREWFEGELKTRFGRYYPYCIFELLPLPTQRKERCKRIRDFKYQHTPFDDVDIMFLAGGTCRIPFIQEWIKEQVFPAQMIIDGQLEIITATGAAIHALQVLIGEFEPYIKIFEHPIACTVTRNSDEFKINIYGVKTKQKLNYFWSRYKPIHEIIDELVTKYGNKIGIIAIDNERGYCKKKDFKKYGNLVHLAIKEELNFNYHLEEKVEYSVRELIMLFQTENLLFGKAGNIVILYQCTTAAGGRVTWKELDERKHGFNQRIDFEYAARMFGLRINQVHAVFKDSRKNVNELYDSELNKYGFKTINFIQSTWNDDESLLFARHLISDPEVSVFVKIEDSYKSSPKTYTIEDCNFIYIPKLVEEYEGRTDIMGIDFGSTRSVLAVSRNRQIHVIPFDNSSPGDLWTESVVSFDEEKPIIGRAAVRRLRTKPDHVIFDHKLLYNQSHRYNISKQSIWPFKYNVKDQPQLELQTYQGLEDFSLSKINAIFLERMAEAASKYQDVFNNRNSVRKAVITVPRYSDEYLSSAIEAAKLANIELIDIIEETHADLLYYLSDDRYSEMIKPGKKIAIFDIGGGTCIWRVYEISELEGKRYATCIRESHEKYDAKCSGRAIDNIITEKLEESIPEDLRSNVKLRTLEAAKEIKRDLSFEEKTELDLSDIHPRLEGIVEFTREWFEKKLMALFNDEFYYDTFILYPLPTQRKDRCKQKEDCEYEDCEYEDTPFNDGDIVFLAGGTCRIPFIQEWIKEQVFPAQMIIDGQLEIITATGAAIHALQVLSGEVEPYIQLIEKQSSETDCDNEESKNKIDIQSESLNDVPHSEDVTTNNECQHENESYSTLSNEKDNSNNDFSYSKEVMVKNDQTAGPPTSKIDDSERNRRRKALPEPSQEEVDSKKKCLLP